jgi:large subunit ribosomal protein L1
MYYFRVEYKTQRPFDKSHYPAAIDDVYFYRKYQHKAWDFAEAVANHRETHHPSVYNVPNAPLNLRIDMDFRYPNRPNKYDMRDNQYQY